MVSQWFAARGQLRLSCASALDVALRVPHERSCNAATVAQPGTVDGVGEAADHVGDKVILGAIGLRTPCKTPSVDRVQPRPETEPDQGRRRFRLVPASSCQLDQGRVDGVLVVEVAASADQVVHQSGRVAEAPQRGLDVRGPPKRIEECRTAHAAHQALSEPLPR